ncbi:SPX domain protein [Aspergillus sclerotioniger CBS 115572]|uniref:SPX domain protein n=1 Tax=Aspergillus sclerotioniger CBS 115572 TaxID=1450535 RepID=A0A317VVN3_9EURO|nr:SPX domain protein [Aspergillus sclerotioniger CBS 115572]PWY78436.1 SPX domain protein [Aspergillus sclerotioniger CBS 115572]
MRFGKTLRNSIYPPWAGNYIDYHRLKVLLREHDVIGDGSDSESTPWTEQDEEAFVQELLNVQLDKVNAFQMETLQQLRERTTTCETRLRPLTTSTDDEPPVAIEDEEKKRVASDVMQELDGITKEVTELEKYSRINFTGFLKAAKKHDRKRGTRYRVKPLLQVRLSQLPFNSEDYSPLVRRLSVMYSFAREILSQGVVEAKDPAEPRIGQDVYSSFKFWVHADNVLEVKTYILRQLPVLIYNPGTSKDLNTVPDDPTITSLYFDNPQFDLYTQKVARAPEAGSLRLRWTGNLHDKPAIFLEKKVVTDDDRSREVKVQLKQKHVKEFLDGEYRFDKKVHRLENMGNGDSEQAEALKKDVDELQSFIKEHNLQPMLRANYTRTAFQIPGDDRIRISLDTNLALIREDSLEELRPCREANEWHRRDIDDAGMEYPFQSIRTGEIARFPHALLEIKLRGDATHSAEWVKDLMVSHLVKEAPRFSKFVHGVAQLFEDYVNSFPFWLGELESDIRRDPATAFNEERERLAKRVEDEMAVGSFLGGKSPSTRLMVGSPVQMFTETESSRHRQSPQIVQPSPRPSAPEVAGTPERQEPVEDAEQEVEPPVTMKRLAALFPSFNIARQNRANADTVVLPPGVRDPGTWIKDSGPVRVETKVWLANQRTFIKWLHVSILLSSLSLGLYNAAGKNNDIARALSIVYTSFAIFAAGWGWYMHEKRARLIRQRSGRDLDNMFGPIVVCIGLAIALVLNFAFKYNSTLERLRDNQPVEPVPGLNSTAFINKSNMWQLVNQGGHTL